MTSTTTPPSTASSQNVVPALVLGIVVGLLLALVAVPAAMRHVGAALRSRLTMAFLGQRETINLTQPTVVASIRRLARLESVVYTMDKVVEGDRTSEYLPDFLTGDKLLLIVHGQAIAGVDLGRLQPGDVEIEGRSVFVNMPRAELLSVSLDNSRTRVYSRVTGLLTPADPGLESQTRQKAEDDLRQSALASGILNSAEANARATLTTLLHSLGFEQVTFR
jgi:hypothetical protein